jgi:oligosaccharide repeat unit polymerase
VTHSSARNRPRVWHLSPIAMSIMVAAASIIPTALLDDQQFRSMWKSPKSVTTETLLLFGCGALALAFGALVTIAAHPHRQLNARWPQLDDASIQVLRRSSTVLTALTLVGYIGFVFLIARSGLGATDLLSSSRSDTSGPRVRDVVGTIPGITTLTQCGVAVAVVSSILLTQQFCRRELLKIVLILAPSIPRAYLFSERLAILEVMVPMIAIFCARLAVSEGPKRFAAQLAPIVGLPAAIALFSFFEYFRSWTFYRTRTSSDFGAFAIERLAGYYATALNNGYLVLHYLDWPGRWPYDTIEAVWTAPLIKDSALYTRLTGHPMPYGSGNEPVTALNEVLTQHANPEFNSPSGFAAPFIDYGTLGGVLFFFLIGLVAGFLYKGFCDGRPFGLLLYPIIYIGLLELPRSMHWSAGRTTYPWLALIVVAALLSRSQRRSPIADMPNPTTESISHRVS